MIPVLYPDIEQIVIDTLPAMLADHGQPDHLPVGTAVPNPRPAKFIRVLATGGERLSRVHAAPLLTVEAWATRESDAHALALLARALLATLAGRVVNGHTIYRADDFSMPANLPDPSTAQARYTFTGPVLVRGLALT